MTAKQDAFIVEYLKDLNATAAAIRAGYSKDTAFIIGWENLRKPKIKEAIDKQLEESLEESKAALKARLIGELKDVAFGDSGIELLRDKEGEVYDIRVTDKLKAIDLLGKYLAIWTEKKDVTVNGGLDIIISRESINADKD